MTWQDWKRGQVNSDTILPLIRLFVPCKHCDNENSFSSPCDSCVYRKHTKENCSVCKRFYAKGKIFKARHHCEHCGLDFELRSAPCKLCPSCFSLGHTRSKKDDCFKCTPDLVVKKEKPKSYLEDKEGMLF